MLETRYQRRQLLRHHAGSVWKVIRSTPEGDYRIKCVVGTIREGFIGGEVEGRVVQVHADYLHGDGWRLEEGAATARPDCEPLLYAARAIAHGDPHGWLTVERAQLLALEALSAYEASLGEGEGGRR